MVIVLYYKEVLDKAGSPGFRFLSVESTRSPDVVAVTCLGDEAELFVGVSVNSGASLRLNGYSNILNVLTIDLLSSPPRRSFLPCFWVTVPI